MFWTQFLWKNSMTWGVSPSSTKKPCRWSKVSLDVMLPRFSLTSRAQWCPKPRSSIETTWHHEKVRVRLEDYASYLKETPTDPTDPQLPVYEQNPFIYVYLGVPLVCSRDLLDFFLVVSEWLITMVILGLWGTPSKRPFHGIQMGVNRPYEGTSKWWKSSMDKASIPREGGIGGGAPFNSHNDGSHQRTTTFTILKKIGHWSWSPMASAFIWHNKEIPGIDSEEA